MRVEAHKNVNTGLGRIKRWWMQKYKLPASHDLFQSQTMAELVLEQYEDLYEEKDDLERKLAKDPAAQDMGLTRERLLSINKVLDEVEEQQQDDLIEFWESEIAAGRSPNLNMKPSDLLK